MRDGIEKNITDFFTKVFKCFKGNYSLCENMYFLF